VNTDIGKVLDRDALIEQARIDTGLTEFGDHSFIDALDRYLDGLCGEAKLSETGLAAEQMAVARLLANRLRIHDALARTPNAAEESVTNPVIIIGMPRSGTTKLHRMMARDVRFQTLPLWKILNPVPLGPDPDTRVEIAEGFVGMLRQESADFAAAHPMDAREVDEEEFLMEHTFLTYAAFYQARIPSYQAWVLKQNFDRWYREFHRLLQLMQNHDSAAGRRWLLKAPSHTAHLDKIFEYFPEAVIVHCHRDPQSVVPSLCGLIRAVRVLYSDQVDLEEIGAWALDHWPPLLELHTRQRDHWLAEGKTIIDVPYSRLVSDGLPVIEELYRRAGIEFSADARAAVVAWQDDNPQHRHGRHRYDMAEFGLSPDAIDREFAGYCERFGHLW
jgi:hypothetical protein